MSDESNKQPEDARTIFRRAILKANPDAELLPPSDEDMDAFTDHMVETIEKLTEWVTHNQKKREEGNGAYYIDQKPNPSQPN